jgi:hypothetical protein
MRGGAMAAKRTFISFDYDYDVNLKNLLAGQAKNSDTPFSISDWSVKTAFTGDWKEKVRERIRNVDLVVVLCGQYSASGVDVEVEITRDEGVPYFLLKGYSDKICKRPMTSRTTDQMYAWTWENLKILIGGGR